MKKTQTIYTARILNSIEQKYGRLKNAIKYWQTLIRAHHEGTGPPGLRGSPLNESLKKQIKSLTLKKNQRMRKIKNSCFATG